MAEEFLNDTNSTPTPPNPFVMPPREREAVRVILIGSRRGIENLILTLYSLDFAQIHEWSAPNPNPKAANS